MKDKTDSLVAFAMEFAIRNTVSPKEAVAIFQDMYLGAYNMSYYVERFRSIPPSNRWRQAGREYLIAGMAFHESCGTTGNADADNLIKQFGVNVFTTVFTITKDELKKVRLRM